MNQHANLSASELTLADVLDAVDRAPDLSATRKRDLRSDVKAIARWLDRSPSSLNADGNSLRSFLDELHHVQIGVSEKRLRNAISNPAQPSNLPPYRPSGRGKRHTAHPSGKYCWQTAISLGNVIVWQAWPRTVRKMALKSDTLATL